MTAFRLSDTSRTSHTVALASLVAFVTQVVFALLMLRLFTPEEVGEFSVLSQIGFFWMTLALAQAPLSLLANAHLPAELAARHAWRASLARGLWLLPLVALALAFSKLNSWPALLWVLLLAVFQMGWTLAQAFSLRVGTSWQQAAVRVLPPLTATCAALTAVLMGANTEGAWPSLVLSAVLGYAVGAAWLLPAWRQVTTPSDARRADASDDAMASNANGTLSTDASAVQADTRSTRLRMAHTAVDAVLATAIVLVWQRLYGVQETGWMTALLRVLGFLPAMVHMAWAQVMLAKPQTTSRASPWWLGLVAFVCVILLGIACATALYEQWLDARWSGVWAYIAPLVLWQGCACLSAAFSHRPFQTQSATMYSWLCMGLALAQGLVLLAPLVFGVPLSAAEHVSGFALVSSLGLLAITAWMAKLR
jgi:hypothetical protein